MLCNCDRIGLVLVEIRGEMKDPVLIQVMLGEIPPDYRKGKGHGFPYYIYIFIYKTLFTQTAVIIPILMI